MKKLLFILSILFTPLIFLSGCGPSSVAVRVRPQPPVYVRPVAPGSGYIWVNGEWIKRRHGYAYREGHWATPRPLYRQYVQGHWQQKRQGWYWIPGHWR